VRVRTKMQSLCKPFLVLLFAVGGVSVAQTNNAFHVPILQARLPQAAQSAQPQASTTAPLTLTFQDALTRAKANAIDFLQARTEAGIAREDRVQARAALLPSVNFNNEAIYT
jgi:hypothetical protein